MSAPPWVFACIFSIAVAWSSDRRQEKVSFHVLKRSTHSNTNSCRSSGISLALFAWVSWASSSASQPRSLPRDTLRSSSKQAHTLGTSAIRRNPAHKVSPLTTPQLHRLLLLDQLIFPSPSRKARSSDRPDQRFQPDWQHHRLIRLVR
jgi:hypothetical protein